MLCNTSTKRDLITIRSRAEHEGPSFFTITLPDFSKCFERSIESGVWLPELFTGFSRSRNSCLPKFLQGFTNQVFNSLTGELRDDSSIEAVEAVRQICLCFNKIKMDCTQERQRTAGVAFERCEADVSSFRIKKWELLDEFSQASDYYLGAVISRVSDRLSDIGKLAVRHGKGTTVDGTYGNRKYNHRQWSLRLERTFPSSVYWFANFGELASEVVTSFQRPKQRGSHMEFLPEWQEPPVRVIFVPKTLKSPRVIAIEPVYNQYVQQGLMLALVQNLESDKLTRGQINFTKQSINGDLALSSSITREFATVDLKEASDRVHSSLVHQILKRHPSLMKAVFSCRSRYAILPNGRILGLKKFASQGSALCFPFEAMTFYCIAIASYMKANALSVNHPQTRRFAKLVKVYGDDIIVPTKEVDIVLDGLESAGLKINRGKTFSRSFFRESCGTDAYKGHVVTPVYIRNALPTDRTDSGAILSTIATANLFYKKGWWKAAAHLRMKIEDVCGVVPHVLETSPVAGWYSYLGTYCIDRYSSDLQRFEVRGLIPSTKEKVDPLYGYRALAKFFTERTSDYGWWSLIFARKSSDEAYAKSVRRGSVYTKIRWASPT